MRFAFIDNLCGWIQYVCVRIIKESFLKESAKAHPRAADSLAKWVSLIKAAVGKNPAEMSASVRSVDPVMVKSGSTTYVFNIRGNEFRLIVAVHFNRQRVYTLRFLTHAEYDRQNWKDELWAQKQKRN